MARRGDPDRAHGSETTPAGPAVEGADVAVYHGEPLSRYSFGRGHPFAADRQQAFWSELTGQGLDRRVRVVTPVQADRDEIELFHAPAYVDRVQHMSEVGEGYLDYGDTPAFLGAYEAAAYVVGTTLDAVRRLAAGEVRRAFVPVAGLHHARRGAAAGFCVFNDCGVAIEALRARHGIHRIGYVDIDAHHGDGVLYEFEDDPLVFIADIHEDGRFLFPGTGWPHETGSGPAEGSKLNLPLPPGAGDTIFRSAWERVEAHVDAARPEIILFQCGADSLANDPLTHLELSPAAHRHAAERLCALADRHCHGRVLALGGGGYNPQNLANAWCEVVRGMLGSGEG